LNSTIINTGFESTLVVAWNKIKYVADVRKDLNDVPQIHARGGEINQVILNILVNAAQAIADQNRSEKGVISVHTESNDEWVTMTIRDDGPGIPREILQKVFDPFFTTKEPGKGTGLGLSISYDIIVNKHKGKLSVKSLPGKGTVFIIALPVNGEIPPDVPEFPAP
jgi:signal transduction histidine kinase